MTTIACVGGFLGAGKTTVILAAARVLAGRGMRVGIITNDQGHHLVDTALVRDMGFPAEEVGGGCFCCRFSEFAKKGLRLVDQAGANFILAEAVGSCTDLSATVCQRLRRYDSASFSVAPLSVMVDPWRVREMFGALPPFNQDVQYLFRKQLAEADRIVLTKADLFSKEEMNEFPKAIQELAGDVPVSTMSAKTGSGLAEWLNWIQQEQAGDPRLELDYDRYGAAEASLGWLNANLDLTSDSAFQVRDLGEALVSRIQQVCRVRALDIAHLKVMMVSSAGSNWIALTGTKQIPTWGESPELPACREASMIVNARVCTVPDQLEHMVRDSVLYVTASRSVFATIRQLEAFSPPPPTRPEMIAGG
jgi:G3E family GTPase